MDEMKKNVVHWIDMGTIDSKKVIEQNRSTNTGVVGRYIDSNMQMRLKQL